jgi:hypothetical protein
VSVTGRHSVTFCSVDNADNSETAKSVSFSIKGRTATALSSSLNPRVYGQAVKLTRTVRAAYRGPATGSVTFKEGTITLGQGTLSGGKASLTTSELGAEQEWHEELSVSQNWRAMMPVTLRVVS